MEKIHGKGLYRLFFIFMKYTTLIAMVMCTCSSFLFAERTVAQTMHEKKITVQVKKMPLADVLELIELRSGFRFVYNQTDIQTARKVSLNANNLSVADVLKNVFQGVPMHVRQQGESILLIPGKPVVTQAAGSIQGTVTDAENGQVLPGANVVIEGTTQGVLADVSGKFTLTRIVPGTYNVVISFVGYQSKKIEGVSVASNNATTLTASLSPGTALKEIVVEAGVDVRYTPIEHSTEQSLLSDMKLSNNIVTGISNVQITRSLDRDAADVMKRVPGVTVLNNFVLIRGLDPRYNVTYLNGMLTPSTESDSRAFAFNLIPSGLIDDIKIYKLPSPELPAGFGGGVIKVGTPRNQVARRFEINVSGQYRTGGSSFANHYTGSNNSSKDMWAMGAKDREMPAKFYDKNYELPRSDFYPAERMAAIRTMPPANNLVKDRSNFDRRLSLNYYDSYRLGGVRLNNLLSLGYTYQRNFLRNHIVQGWTKRDSVAYEGKQVPNIAYEAVDSVYTEDVRLSLLESLGIILNENHRIDINLFANRSAADNTIFSSNSNMTTLSEPLNSGLPPAFRTLAFEYQVRDLLSGQISGEHQFGSRHHVDWRIGQNRMEEFIPDFQMYKYRRWSPKTYGIILEQTVNGNAPRQYYRTKDKSLNAGVDYAFAIKPFLTLKAGGLLQLGTRDFTNMVYTTTVPTNGGDAEFKSIYLDVYQPWGKQTEIFSDANYRDNLTGFNMQNSFSALSYHYEQNISSVYIAPLLKFFDNKLEVYGGVRYENEYTQLFDAEGAVVTKIRLPDKQIQDPETGEIRYEPVFGDFPGPNFNYFLPSMNATWNLTDKQKLRGGYGRTLDRPAFRERSNAVFYNTRDGSNYIGNLNLKNAELDNYDLRWEWYPTDTEFISAGGFYKYIENPIEMVESGTPESRLYKTWYNKKWAKLYGIELELRKNLSFVPARYSDRFSVIANAAFVHTVVKDIYETPFGTAVAIRSTRPLTGSSPYIYNVTLYYEAPRSKAVVTVAYNEIGERVIASSPDWAGNLHERAQRQLDLVVIHPIGKYFKIKAGVQNLLKQDIVRWRDGNYDGKYNPGKFTSDSKFSDQADHEAERWNPGSYYSLGITATF